MNGYTRRVFRHSLLWNFVYERGRLTLSALENPDFGTKDRC